MSDEDCIHGMPRAWCALCNGTEQSSGVARSRAGEQGFHGGQSKQDLLDHVCSILGIPPEPIGVGSSLPSGVFSAAADRVGIPRGSMPEIGERIATKAGLTWGPECDSRGTASAGGSTVTKIGLEVMLKALTTILRSATE